jgi:hypothetical protein
VFGLQYLRDVTYRLFSANLFFNVDEFELLGSSLLFDREHSTTG